MATLMDVPSPSGVHRGVLSGILSAAWVALFLAFQSQSWCTNDDTGYTLKVCSHEEHEQKNAVHS